jgi:hypothetical protein
MSHYIADRCSIHGEYAVDSDNIAGCPECFTLEEAITYLYSHEINVTITSFWDAGFSVGLGDAMNGHGEAKNFQANELWKAGNWLVEEAKKKYPNAEWKKKP